MAKIPEFQQIALIASDTERAQEAYSDLLLTREWASLEKADAALILDANARDLAAQDYSDTDWWKEILETQLIPAGRYAQSRYLITDRSQYGPRWQEHVGDIVAAGLGFGSGPCFELYHSVSNDPLRDDVSFCSSVR